MRIEIYTKRPLADCFYFLREVNGGPEEYKSHEKVHVVAEEINDDGKVGRWWFVISHGLHGFNQDGYFADWFPPHVEVDSQSIRPGEPSAPFKGWVKRGVKPPDETEMTQLRQQRLSRLACEVRHTLYLKQVVDDRAKLVEQAARIASLESSLSEADGRNREFGERAVTLASDLAATKTQLDVLQQEKSLTHRVREWGRSWSTKRD